MVYGPSCVPCGKGMNAGSITRNCRESWGIRGFGRLSTCTRTKIPPCQQVKRSAMIFHCIDVAARADFDRDSRVVRRSKSAIKSTVALAEVYLWRPLARYRLSQNGNRTFCVFSSATRRKTRRLQSQPSKLFVQLLEPSQTCLSIPGCNSE